MAYSAEYKDGRMTTTPEAHHLSSGTVITSRKLFNSLAVRRESLKAGEEKRRVIKIISVFALHYSSVRFRLMCDGKVELTTEHNAGNQPDSQLSIFSKLYETSINDIFRAETELDTHTKLSSILTKTKISKGKTLILLVNNRIV
jgi:DNA mismatch repair ATPase MutL